MTQTINRTKDFFALRDKADAESLKIDVTQAIASAVAGNYERLWIFTNVNGKVIKMVTNQLDLRALHQLNLSVMITNNSPEEEIKWRVKAVQENIPTLTVISEIDGAANKLFFA
jgi:hypothetical protein